MLAIDNNVKNEELEEKDASVTNNQHESKIASFFWGLAVDSVILGVDIISAFESFVSKTVMPEIVGESHVTVIAEANEALREQNEDNINLQNQATNTSNSLEIILENNSQSQKLDSEIIKQETKSSESMSKAIDVLEEKTTKLKDTPLKDSSKKEELTREALEKRINDLTDDIKLMKNEYHTNKQLKDGLIEDLESEVERLKLKVKQLESNSHIQQQEISNKISFLAIKIMTLHQISVMKHQLK
tara:strand:+ start:2189 stop:2920 length:732 start_codon:yes stop_codon:yes gene_type:complete